MNTTQDVAVQTVVLTCTYFWTRSMFRVRDFLELSTLQKSSVSQQALGIRHKEVGTMNHQNLDLEKACFAGSCHSIQRQVNPQRPWMSNVMYCFILIWVFSETFLQHADIFRAFSITASTALVCSKGGLKCMCAIKSLYNHLQHWFRLTLPRLIWLRFTVQFGQDLGGQAMLPAVTTAFESCILESPTKNCLPLCPRLAPQNSVSSILTYGRRGQQEWGSSDQDKGASTAAFSESIDSTAVQRHLPPYLRYLKLGYNITDCWSASRLLPLMTEGDHKLTTACNEGLNVSLASLRQGLSTFSQTTAMPGILPNSNRHNRNASTDSDVSETCNWPTQMMNIVNTEAARISGSNCFAEQEYLNHERLNEQSALPELQFELPGTELAGSAGPCEFLANIANHQTTFKRSLSPLQDRQEADLSGDFWDDDFNLEDLEAPNADIKSVTGLMPLWNQASEPADWLPNPELSFQGQVL